VQEDGATLRQQLLVVAEQGEAYGIATPAELAPVPCPPEGEYLLDWFNELSTARGAGFGTVNPITFESIRAWREETSSPPLLPWELLAIRRLDAVLIGFANRSKKDKTKPQE
jgi:hypothetical protein